MKYIILFNGNLIFIYIFRYIIIILYIIKNNMNSINIKLKIK